MRRPVIAAADLDFLRAGDPSSGGDPLADAGLDLPSAVARLEVAMIRQALDASRGNRTAAARQLGIHRQLLHEKIRRYGLDSNEG